VAPGLAGDGRPIRRMVNRSPSLARKRSFRLLTRPAEPALSFL